MSSIQSPVLTSSNMNFLRLSLNELATRINTITDTSFVVNGNVIISISDPAGVALNVSNGTIRGNGSQLFSINALSLLGVANNSQLQNATITIIAANGLSSNISTVALGQSIRITANVIDSITSNSNSLPASANSLRAALIFANSVTSNASAVTTYVVEQERGGTGKSSHEVGKILIGNSFSSQLETGQIISGHGIIVSSANGSITVSANLIAGPGIVLQSSGNSGITITSNAYAEGNTSANGTVRLFDGINSTSTSLAATSNAVNSLMIALSAVPTKNTFGRLISRNVYTTSNFAGITGQSSGTQYTWTKPDKASYINIMVLSGGAAGGSSLNVWNSNETSWFPRVYNVNTHVNRLTTSAFFGGPGAAGSVAYWSGPASSFGESVSLFVGGGGTTRSGGAGNGGDSWFGNTSFLRVPGAPSTNNIITDHRIGSQRGAVFPENPLHSPYSDMAGSSDVLSTSGRFSLAAPDARPGDQWQGYIKGSNNAVKDAGAYTENPNFWDVFRGLSQGVSADLPALGLPWTGLISNDAAGRVTYNAPGSIWPIYGGKGGSTPFGRGGYGGVITTDRTPVISNIKGTGNTPGQNPVYTGNVASNFINDLWYSFGAPSGIYTANGAGESSAATSTTPVAYGAAPHILSITKGIETSFSVTATSFGFFSVPLPEKEVGDRLIVVALTNIGGEDSFGVLNPGLGAVVYSVNGTAPVAGGQEGFLGQIYYIDIETAQGATHTSVPVAVSYPNSISPPTALIYYIFRVAKGTQYFSIDTGLLSPAGRRGNAFNPPQELDLSTQTSTWGRTTNTVTFITFTGGYHVTNNPATGQPIVSMRLISPRTTDLSSDSNWSLSTKQILGYGIKIKKETGSSTTVTSADKDWEIEGIDSGGTSNTSFNALKTGSFPSITIALRGNTAAPWNMRTAGLSQNHYQVRDPIGLLVGEMDSGVWYYKFQHGQDATGYGAGGGGAVKGTGNFPWDGKSWQVHGGNGAPGLVIVEAYSV